MANRITLAILASMLVLALLFIDERGRHGRRDARTARVQSQIYLFDGYCHILGDPQKKSVDCEDRVACPLETCGKGFGCTSGGKIWAARTDGCYAEDIGNEDQ